MARSETVAEPDLTAPSPEVVLWEEHLRKQIESDGNLTSTQKETLILARRGQGLFRQRVQERESHCRITGVGRAEHLRASHSKPWRDSTHEERLDGDNGLLLTPSIDHLFDRGFISFRSDGRLVVSPVAHGVSLARMGVPVDREFDAGGFTPGQIRFLEYHRDAVLLKSRTGK
jgi:predicted restriction endonuclease